MNRDACLIAFNDTDTMILTGGSYGGRPLDDVSVYTEAGWKEELPKLNKARYMHGCSTYISDGNRVRSNIILLPHFILLDPALPCLARKDTET